MNTATHYARALFALIEQKPKSASVYLHNLGRVLEQRGHQKLLPRIFSEYRKLQEAKDRTETHKTTTPEQERTRQLLELYRKLTQTA